MPIFSYKALDKEGKLQSGTLDSNSLRQARQQLRDDKLLPVEVVFVQENQRKTTGFTLFQRSISGKDLAMVTRQLATLLQAGLPVEEALLAVAAQQGRGRLHNMLQAVRSQVLEGYSLAQGMELYPVAFPSMYRATVAAGEHSGHLDAVLSRLADYWEKHQKSVQQVKLALIYPSVLTFVSIAIVSFLLSYVVPQFVKVFASSGKALPGLTVMLIAISDFVRHYGLALLLCISIAGYVFKQLLKRNNVRMQWHITLLNLPVVGNFSRSYNTARFAATLSILTRSGVSLVDALVISSKVLSNDALRKVVVNAAREVSEGSSLHAAFERSGVFTPLMLHMIASGEQTGELDMMLERIADNQDMDLEYKLSLMLGLFEPFILVIMGSVVLVIVLAILMPIININQMVG